MRKTGARGRMLWMFNSLERAMQLSANNQIRNSVTLISSKYVASLPCVLIALFCITSAGCASTAPYHDRAAQRLVEISAIAGKPVPWFTYLSLNSYEPVGESDVLMFTSPRQAWLLHLYGSCPDLAFGQTVGLTSNLGRVSAGFDQVIVRDSSIPCRIQQIRPVDSSVLRRIDRGSKPQAPFLGLPSAG